MKTALQLIVSEMQVPVFHSGWILNFLILIKQQKIKQTTALERKFIKYLRPFLHIALMIKDGETLFVQTKLM